MNSKHGQIRHIFNQDFAREPSSGDDYTFSVNQVNSVTDNIVVNVGSVDLKMIIDSGNRNSIVELSQELPGEMCFT